MRNAGGGVEGADEAGGTARADDGDGLHVRRRWDKELGKFDNMKPATHLMLAHNSRATEPSSTWQSIWSLAPQSCFLKPATHRKQPILSLTIHTFDPSDEYKTTSFNSKCQTFIAIKL
jgi:hypothetical protein